MPTLAYTMRITRRSVQLSFIIGFAHAFSNSRSTARPTADRRWDAKGEVEPWPSALPIPEHAIDIETATKATEAMAGAHPTALEGRPQVNLENAQWLHVDPPVLIVDDFISDKECDEVLRLTTAQPPPDAGRIIQIESRSYADGRDDSSPPTNAENNHRISTTWYVRYGCDAVAPLLSGMSNLLPKINVEQVEEVQLVRYAGSGQGFGWHEDALEKDVVTSENGGQRIATLLIYLNECDGGRTLFRDLVGDNNMRLGVEPTKGRALLFFPPVTGDTVLGDAALIADSGATFGGELFDNTRSDRRTMHAGEPPNGPAGRREKYIAQLWIHGSKHTPVVFGQGLNKHSEARRKR